MATLTISAQTINQITISLNEKDIENAYRQFLSRKISDIKWTSPFNCDGFGESENHKLRVLCEFKEDLDLTNKLAQVKVLSQAIYYIKKFEISGQKLPTTVLVGDRNECFVIHANDLFKYLSLDLNWSSAASEAYKNTELVSKMMEDDNINPHIFSIYQLEDCLQKLKDLTDGVVRLIPITPHNITEVFNHFETKVLAKNNLTTNELANLFVQILINPEDNYLHPVSKRKTIVTKSFKDVPLKSRESFKSFFSHFSNDYTPRQKEQLTAVVDRLIQDVTRRKQGEFFTPTIWVDKAHEYIASVFGEDWKDKYVVWDPAWGTGNLTRDYKFKELYVSTLNYSDIQTAEQMGYNPEAIKFQYDFLNDPYEYLPVGLKKAIESGRQIIVLMNPPYGTAKNGGNQKGNNKEGLANTKVGQKMRQKSYDKSSAQLYAQFIYRITNEFSGNFNLAFFAKSSYKTAVSFQKTRVDLSKKMGFQKGFIFNAKHFDSTSDKWGVDFSIFNNLELNNGEYLMDILDSDNDFNIVKVGEKVLYSTDNKIRACDWIRQKLNKKQRQLMKDYPNFSSSFVVNNKFSKKININGYIGGYCELSNSVYQNSQGVVLGSSISILGNTVSIPIYSENFLDTVGMFGAKRLIEQNWLNDKDEYLAPNENSQIYNRFIIDSVIFSLFNNASTQSGLRKVNYKNQLWDIKNQFFWMSKNEMMELANQNNFTELYNDARTDSDRYVHNLLFGEQRIYDQLSPEAKDVLDTATQLVRQSMTIRVNFADDNNHLNSWDSGYAQLKLLWKEYFPDQFKEFRAKYKALEDKMRPMVYELGFLKK
jgi:hypothetical protein